MQRGSRTSGSQGDHQILQIVELRSEVADQLRLLIKVDEHELILRIGRFEDLERGWRENAATCCGT
jgi:hypothetical protein